MKMKKNQETSPLEKQNLNNAFFMPTVMAYIIIFLTFLLWQVNEVVGYQSLSSDFMDSTNREMALIKLEEKIERDAMFNKNLPCIPSIYPPIPFKYDDYSISSTVYCVRMPQEEYLVPNNNIIMPMVKVILQTPQELNYLLYKGFQAGVLALYSAERFLCWIGIPFDVISPNILEAGEYVIVQSMPKYLIIDSTIKSKNSTLYVTIFYNLDNMEVEKMVYS